MTSPARRPGADPPPAPARPADEEEFRAYVGRMSHAEYRRYSEASDYRLEYVDGVVYAMSGGTSAHGIIALNIGARLRQLVRGTRCRAYSSTYRVKTPRKNEYSPDALVACGPRQDRRALSSNTPCLLVEVLSPTTARVDLTEKRDAYREIPTLGAYLIVEAEWRGVHRHWRDDGGVWREETVVGEGGVPLPCPAGGVLTLADVYEDVDLPARPPKPRLPRLRRVYERPAYAPGAEPGEIAKPAPA